MSVERSLYKAIKLYGSKQRNLAQAIGESPDKIRYWLNSGKRVPFHNAIAIEAATGGQVSRFDLAPYARFHNNRVNDIVRNDLQAAPAPTISERAALGIAFEKSLGKRNGSRNNSESRKNFYTINGRTDVLAAKHAGFKNHVSYRQAKKVMNQGIFKLVQAMDEESLAISSAALVSELSPDAQEAILQQDHQQIAATIKQLREKKTRSNTLAEAELHLAEQKYQLPLRLVLLGLKTYCSGKKQFPWKPEQLKNQLLPYTNIDFTKLLETLATCGFIRKIMHENAQYGQIIWPKNSNGS